MIDHSRILHKHIQVVRIADHERGPEYRKITLFCLINFFIQDKSLSGVRVVCRNANRFLRRKDSSGSMLKETSTRRGSFQVTISLNFHTIRVMILKLPTTVIKKPVMTKTSLLDQSRIGSIDILLHFTDRILFTARRITERS